MIFVDCYTSWCGPCKMYNAIFESIANNYTNQECHFGRIDVDKATDLGNNYRISKLPTTFIIKQNQIVATAVGVLQNQTLKALVDQYKAKSPKIRTFGIA